MHNRNSICLVKEKKKRNDKSFQRSAVCPDTRNQSTAGLTCLPPQCAFRKALLEESRFLVDVFWGYAFVSKSCSRGHPKIVAENATMWQQTLSSPHTTCRRISFINLSTFCSVVVMTQSLPLECCLIKRFGSGRFSGNDTDSEREDRTFGRVSGSALALSVASRELFVPANKGEPSGDIVMRMLQPSLLAS